MPRKPRLDGPDVWHHVMNRGIAKRTVFETDRDYRMFLALVAKEVRAGRIEVHAFSLMPNHFHMLVRSVDGRISVAMRKIQCGYSRWFNRSRRRDGPLYRGRFNSSEVDDLQYRRDLMSYIHDNPVKAALVATGADHHVSSAWHFARAKRPRWLAATWVDDEIRRRGGTGSHRRRLLRAFPTRVDEEFRAHIERKLAGRRPLDEPDDVTLRYVGSLRAVRWAIRKAKAADGTRPYQPLVSPQRVEQAVARASAGRRPWLERAGRRTRDLWRILRAALLRLAGDTLRAIGCRLNLDASTICRDLQYHRSMLARSPEYESAVARLTHAVLATTN